jgi:hypothetical protein
MAVPPRSITATRLWRARRDETMHVRCARMRGTKRGRRRSLLVTGATTVMTTGDGGRWRTVRGWTRERGRGEMGPGGPYAHQERVGVDGDAEGGQTATPWLTTCYRLAEKWSSIPPIGGFPASASWWGGSGRRGGAPEMLGGARGSLQRWVWWWPKLGFQSGAHREEEKEREGEALGLLRGGRGALIANGRRRCESWHRRARRRLHAGASRTKVGDDSLESGWAKVRFARDERGRELGRIWPRTWKGSFFFQKSFLILYFQNLLQT